MPSITQVSQSPNPGEKIELFRLDTTKLGGPVLFFCKGALEGGASVVFGGVTYKPTDLKLSDFEMNAGGALPQPKMQIANSDDQIQQIVNTYGDLAGAEIRRVRTFKRFLDGQPDADPSAFIGPDVFKVERKSDENPSYVEWELSAALDQEGKMLPGRQVLRDTCVKRYRIYDPTNPEAAEDGFVYATVNACPYTGTNNFNTQDASVEEKSQDRCSRHLTGCELRFGKSNPLPFGGFPAAARVRQ
jgi:lambda family phage minor tail protein L